MVEVVSIGNTAAAFTMLIGHTAC